MPMLALRMLPGQMSSGNMSPMVSHQPVCRTARCAPGRGGWGTGSRTRRPQPGHQIGGAGGGFQACRQLHQHLVAGGVAEAVVDGLGKPSRSITSTAPPSRRGRARPGCPSPVSVKVGGWRGQSADHGGPSRASVRSPSPSTRCRRSIPSTITRNCPAPARRRGLDRPQIPRAAHRVMFEGGVVSLFLSARQDLPGCCHRSRPLVV